MAYRSQFERLLRTSLAALLGATLVPLLVAGCQSNAQQDLVARELRMQEDQIYALEDYLDEYQQLICKYRMENAALRRQLGDVDDATLPAPRPSARERNGPAATNNGPAIEAPPPKIDGTRPQQQLEIPEVPPLRETTSRDLDGEAALAAGESITAAESVIPAAAIEPAPSEQIIHDVWLHGEVVENDTGGGPRLVVEIEPRDTSGRAVEFTGSLSLMLLAPDGNGGQQSLARWDFAPEDLQSAIDAATDEYIIRFHLELPADTPITDSTEIWVRLLPQGGEKLLARAAIGLHEPGKFSSLPQAPPLPKKPEEQPAIAFAEKTRPANTPPLPSDIDDGGWTIARPGEPANLADASEDSTSEWRASAETMPIARVSRPPARARPRTSRPGRKRQSPSAAIALDRTPAAWSPDRPHDEAAGGPRMATMRDRPRWSASR